MFKRMDRIKDGRRNILIHGNAESDDLPVSEFPDVRGIANTEPFVPVNMDDPELYPGDVIVGVYDGEIEFVELIYDKIDSGVLIIPMESGRVEFIEDQRFSSRFFNADEIHIYDDVVDDIPEVDVEFDESKLVYPETSRPR